MKAIGITEFGSPDVLTLEERPEPSIRDDQLLVRIRAASTNPYDWHHMTGLPYLGRPQFGWRRPVVRGLGADLAGTVKAGGCTVRRFRPGDEVYGEVDGETPGRPNPELGVRTMRMNTDDLSALTRLIEAGEVAPVIDRTYPLAEAADAMRYLDRGHARGKIVVRI